MRVSYKPDKGQAIRLKSFNDANMTVESGCSLFRFHSTLALGGKHSFWNSILETSFRNANSAVRGTQSVDVATRTTTIESLQRWLFWVKQDFSLADESPVKLFKKDYESLTTKQVEIDHTGELCEAFVDMISDINIVRQVFIARTEEVTTICTIIDAPPFEDSLRAPIYDAELRTLRMVEGDIRLDFHVFNISELSGGVKLKHIVPANANLVWER